MIDLWDDVSYTSISNLDEDETYVSTVQNSPGYVVSMPYEETELLRREDMLCLTWASLKLIYSRLGLGIVIPSMLHGDKKESLVNKLMVVNKVRWGDLNFEEQLCILARNKGVSHLQKEVEDNFVFLQEMERQFPLVPIESSPKNEENISKLLCAQDLNCLSLKQIQDLFAHVTGKNFCPDEEKSLFALDGDIVKSKQMMIDNLINISVVTEYDLSEDFKNIISKQNILLERKWQERNECTSPEFSELHLQLLSQAPIRNLYESKEIGITEKVKSGECKRYRFFDLSSNLVQWEDVVTDLLQTVTWRDFDQSCLDAFKEIYESLKYVKNLLTEPTNASATTLTTEELMFLPIRVLTDLSILKGLGCYKYGENRYIYTFEGVTVVCDPKQMANRLLWIGLTKAELRTYVDNMIERLSPINYYTSSSVKVEPTKPKRCPKTPMPNTANDASVAGDLIHLKLKQLKTLYLQKNLGIEMRDKESSYILGNDGNPIDNKRTIIENLLEYVTRKDLGQSLLTSIETSKVSKRNKWNRLHQLPKKSSSVSKTCLLLLTPELRTELFSKKKLGEVIREKRDQYILKASGEIIDERQVLNMLEKSIITPADLNEKCVEQLRDAKKSLQMVIGMGTNLKSCDKCTRKDIMAMPINILKDLYIFKGLGNFYKNSLTKLSTFEGSIMRSKQDIVSDLMWIGLTVDELKGYAKDMMSRVSYVQLH